MNFLPDSRPSYTPPDKTKPARTFSLLVEGMTISRPQVFKDDQIRKMAFSLAENAGWQYTARRVRMAVRELALSRGVVKSGDFRPLTNKEGVEELPLGGRKIIFHWNLPEVCTTGLCFVKTKDLAFGFDLRHLSAEAGTSMVLILQGGYEQMKRLWGNGRKNVGCFASEDHWQRFGHPKDAVGFVGSGGHLKIRIRTSDELPDVLLTVFHELGHELISEEAEISGQFGPRLEPIVDGVAEFLGAKVLDLDCHQDFREWLAEDGVRERLVLSGGILKPAYLRKEDWPYVIGLSLIDHLGVDQGMAKVKNVLRGLAAGRSFRSSIQSATGKPWKEVAEEWLKAAKIVGTDQT